MTEQRAGRAALLLAVAATLAGLAVGVIAALLEDTPHRADETLVIVRGSTPLSDATAARSLAATIRTLGDSQVVTSNVARALGLGEADVRDRTSVSLAGETAALRIRAHAASSTEAVQLVQQYGAVLTELVRSRFAPLALAPFDPAHGSGRLGRHWTRNVLPGGLVGLLAGISGALVLLRRGPGTPRPPRERKRKVAPPPIPAPEPERQPEPATPPVVQAEPEPQPQRVPSAGDWSLTELRRRVDAAREAHPERVAEWDTYLELLAEQEVDGVLPISFAPLIDDVFGSILY